MLSLVNALNAYFSSVYSLFKLFILKLKIIPIPGSLAKKNKCFESIEYVVRMNKLNKKY